MNKITTISSPTLRDYYLHKYATVNVYGNTNWGYNTHDWTLPVLAAVAAGGSAGLIEETPKQVPVIMYQPQQPIQK